MPKPARETKKKTEAQNAPAMPCVHRGGTWRGDSWVAAELIAQLVIRDAGIEAADYGAQMLIVLMDRVGDEANGHSDQGDDGEEDAHLGGPRLLARGLSENIRPQLVASDDAVGRFLNRYAAFTRHFAALSPFRDGRRLDSESIGECLLGAEGITGDVNWCFVHAAIVRPVLIFCQ